MLSTSTEDPQPSTPSSGRSHTGRHRLVPAGSDPRTPWRCTRGCGYEFADFRAAELLREGKARLPAIMPVTGEPEPSDECSTCGRDTAACYCELAATDPEAEPDCAQCDHPSVAHSGTFSECSEQCDGERCDCEYYFPKGEPEPEVPQPDPAPAPRPARPHVAVTYATTGGQVFETLVPGDAEVSAIDGMLKVSHPGAQVLGIVRIAPWPYPAADGGPDGAEAEGAEG